MGHVITFPLLSNAYPDLTAELDPAEAVLLSAIRWWVESYQAGDDPVPRLCQCLESAGVSDAAFSIDGLMMVVARSVTRPAAIQCPRCPSISMDEKRLLQAASLAQADECFLAAKVLRTTLLSAQGAEFAMGALEGLGTLFAQARLLLSRRRMPVEDRQPSDDPTLSSPPHSLH